MSYMKDSVIDCEEYSVVGELSTEHKQPKAKMVWDKESILALLSTNDAAVDKAVILLNCLQTQDERQSASTTHSNGVGWNSNDAPSGAYYASYLTNANTDLSYKEQLIAYRRTGRRLSGKFLPKARRMVMKYWRQLICVANGEL